MPRPFLSSLPFAYPSSYILFSSYMLSMAFVKLLISILGKVGTTLLANKWMVPIEVPPKPPPPEPAPDPNDFVPKRTRGKAPAKRLLQLGLLAAISASETIPELSLATTRALKKDLRKYRTSCGFMTKTHKLKPDELTRLRHVLETSKTSLITPDDYFELILDSGCSKIVTPHLSDFVPGSLSPLETPLSMDGIAGRLVSHQKGRVRYELLNDTGAVSILECEAYHLPDLKFRLFSPQTYFSEHQGGSLTLEWDKSRLVLPNGDVITIGYHAHSALPLLRGFHSVDRTSRALALEDVDHRPNLTSLQQQLATWHAKWGHRGWQHCQWIGRSGLLGPMGIKMGSTTVIPPKCSACILGKQGRTPKPGVRQVKQAGGILKRDKLTPGELIFSDQYESPLLGRQFSARGNDVSSQKYRGGTIFCDAASGKLTVIHQVGLTATETVQAKLRFEREAAGVGVQVKSYCTDNGIYTSQEFARELDQKGQGIRHSGVGGHHHNGVAENAIKHTVQTARTMMIHAALRWPEHSHKDLWPLALSHAVHLHNETPGMETRVTPHEVWSQSKSSYTSLLNAQPWGCPTYVLSPRLQDGGKIPKWEPRSRLAQYMGVSPLHASTVGLVLNLRTRKISPQYHLVYDSNFETVHSDPDNAPESWPELVTLNRFKADYDDKEFAPYLADEWLTPVEISEKQRHDNHVRGFHDAPPGEADDPYLTEPLNRNPTPQDTDVEVGTFPTPLGESSNPPDSPPRGTPLETPQRAIPSHPPDTRHDQRAPTPLPRHNPRQETPRPQPPRRNPRRAVRNPAPTRQHGLGLVRKYCRTMMCGLLSLQGRAYDNRYLLNLLLDQDFGLYDNLGPSSLLMSPSALSGSTADPDTPRLHEAMRSEHREEFLHAMGKEIADLEKHGTWTVIRKSSMPTEANLLPSTWALKVKRYPDGRLRKHKARFCCRGDKQIKNVDYFESYAPVASWTTVRMVMNMAIQRGWATRQVDFSNAFVQADLEEEVYLELPEMFRDENNHGGSDGVVLKLHKSLYGLVQAPRSWYFHLQAGLKKLDFKVSASDPGMYYGRGMLILTYVDDTLFFGPDLAMIEKTISDLEGLGYGLTREEGDENTAFAFLGVNITPDPKTRHVRLTQTGLIDKILLTTGMTDCNTKGSPSTASPLATDASGPRRKESWSYPSVVGMLMYLASNAHPEIQFAVHQCARFTHCPRASHEEAIKHICRYLKGARGNGLCFAPTDDLTLDCYVDAGFAGLYGYESDQDPVCVRSRTGYVFTLGGCPIQWSSKLQTEIALSTTEAEYIALSQAMRELIPLRRLLLEIGTYMKLSFGPTCNIKSTVFEDNNGAIATATSVKMTPRTKHIAVKYHFFKNHIGPGTGISLSKIDTQLQKADIFTKGLAPPTFVVLRRLLCGW